MNKNKFLSIFSIALLISNLLLIAFIFSNKRPHHAQHSGPKEIIIEKLHFDEAQVEQYNSLIEKHQKDIREKQVQLNKAKNNLYAQLNLPEDKTREDSLLAIASALKLEIEKIHYTHFEDIKDICNEEQLEYFNLLAKELAELFSNKPPGKR